MHWRVATPCLTEPPTGFPSVGNLMAPRFLFTLTFLELWNTSCALVFLCFFSFLDIISRPFLAQLSWPSLSFLVPSCWQDTLLQFYCLRLICPVLWNQVLWDLRATSATSHFASLVCPLLCLTHSSKLEIVSSLPAHGASVFWIPRPRKNLVHLYFMECDLVLSSYRSCWLAQAHNSFIWILPWFWHHMLPADGAMHWTTFSLFLSQPNTLPLWEFSQHWLMALSLFWSLLF